MSEVVIGRLSLGVPPILYVMDSIQEGQKVIVGLDSRYYSGKIIRIQETKREGTYAGLEWDDQAPTQYGAGSSGPFPVTAVMVCKQR